VGKGGVEGEPAFGFRAAEGGFAGGEAGGEAGADVAEVDFRVAAFEAEGEVIEGKIVVVEGGGGGDLQIVVLVTGEGAGGGAKDCAGEVDGGGGGEAEAVDEARAFVGKELGEGLGGKGGADVEGHAPPVVLGVEETGEVTFGEVGVAGGAEVDDVEIVGPYPEAGGEVVEGKGTQVEGAGLCADEKGGLGGGTPAALDVHVRGRGGGSEVEVFPEAIPPAGEPALDVHGAEVAVEKEAVGEGLGVHFVTTGGAGVRGDEEEVFDEEAVLARGVGGEGAGAEEGDVGGDGAA